MRYWIVSSLLGLLSVAYASDFKLRAPMLFFADDRELKFGNTEGTPDAKILWETADADNGYLNLVVPGGDNQCVIIDEDGATDRATACGDPTLIVCSDNASDVDECLQFSHDGDRGVMGTLDGSQVLMKTNGMFVDNFASGDANIFVAGSASSYGLLGFRQGSLSERAMSITADYGDDQGSIKLDTEVGNHLAITIMDANNADIDYDHGTQTHPTLFIHSHTKAAITADEASAGETASDDEWIGFTHNENSGVISTGKGSISFDSEAYTGPAAAWSTNGNASVSTTEQDGYVKTVITADLATASGQIHGQSNVGAVLGRDAAEAAYLTRIVAAETGRIYRAEAIASEAPAGHEEKLEFAAINTAGLKTGCIKDGTGTDTGGAACVGGSLTVVTLAKSQGHSGASDWAIREREYEPSMGTLADTDGYYVYLVTQAAHGSDTNYTAGKLTLILHGVK